MCGEADWKAELGDSGKMCQEPKGRDGYVCKVARGVLVTGGGEGGLGDGSGAVVTEGANVMPWKG